MRELTKSLLTFSWAMSLFSMKQFGSLLASPYGNGRANDAKQAFDDVSTAAQQYFGEILQPAFSAGDDLQRRMVDVMYSLTGSTLNPNRMMDLSSKAAQRAGAAFSGSRQKQSAQSTGPQPGWGPV